LDYLTAVSTDGQQFMLFKNGTWKIDSSPKPQVAVFRSSTWGSSIDEVRRSESEELVHEDKDFLAFESTVANFKVLALYSFVENKLASGRYAFQQPHANKQSYLHDYWKLKELMTEKYGQPKTSDSYWVDELYRDSVDEWGMAVACGHVSFFETWVINDTHIELQLYGDNYEIKLSIMYESISLQGLLEQKRKKNSLSGL
jgi:hypothetical protein